MMRNSMQVMEQERVAQVPNWKPEWSPPILSKMHALAHLEAESGTKLGLETALAMVLLWVKSQMSLMAVNEKLVTEMLDMANLAVSCFMRLGRE
jgi:hypothetical protein